MPTARAVLRKSKVNAQGTAPICLRIADRDRSVFTSLGVRVKPADWNERTGTVRKSHPGAADINDLIKARVAEASTESVRLLKSRRASGLTSAPSAVELKEAVAPTRADSCFLIYAEHVAADHERRGSFQRAQKTLCMARRLKEVSGSPLPFDRVTPALLRAYETHLLTKYENHPNTVRSTFNALRAVLYRAMREGIAGQTGNPFFTFKPVKEVRPDRSKLTLDELRAVEALDLPAGSLTRRVRDCFLFAFYGAGIRFGDLARLRWEHVTEEPDGALRLSYRMSKTSGLKSLRLLPPARAILDTFPPRKGKGGQPSPYLFPILDGYDTSTPRKMRSAVSAQTALANKYLKKIAELAEVKGKLSTHVARHSFADIARARGWDVYSISKALGHANIKVTESYLRGFDTAALDEKMNDLFGGGQ